jgi:regulator of RNase E activity RraB
MGISKDEKYKYEQKEILKEILEELGIKRDNLIISREELETEEFKELMKKKYERVKVYYKTTNWNSVKTGLEKELNILKNVCRYNGIVIDKIQRKKTVEEKRINHVLYKFNIPEELKIN